MNSIVGSFLILACLNAFADGLGYKVESITTEPREIPDPVDQPPVLEYGAEQAAAAERTPANVTPQKFFDAEHNVVCYYILPRNTPSNVVQPGSPVLSCVKLDPKKPTAPPVELPPSQTK